MVVTFAGLQLGQRGLGAGHVPALNRRNQLLEGIVTAGAVLAAGTALAVATTRLGSIRLQGGECGLGPLLITGLHGRLKSLEVLLEAAYRAALLGVLDGSVAA